MKMPPKKFYVENKEQLQGDRSEIMSRPIGRHISCDAMRNYLDLDVK